MWARLRRSSRACSHLDAVFRLQHVLEQPLVRESPAPGLGQQLVPVGQQAAETEILQNLLQFFIHRGPRFLVDRSGDPLVARFVISGQVRLVGQKALLVGRTLAKALVHLHVGQGFLSLAHAEPGDALERFHLDHAIAPRPAEGLDEHGRRHLAAEGEQLAQEAMPLDAGRLEGEVHIGRHLRAQGTQPLFLVLGTVAAMLGQIARRRLALGAEMGVLDPVGRQRILGHAGPPAIDLQAVRVPQHLDVFPLGPRHPVVVPLERRRIRTHPCRARAASTARGVGPAVRSE